MCKARAHGRVDVMERFAAYLRRPVLYVTEKDLCPVLRKKWLLFSKNCELFSNTVSNTMREVDDKRGPEQKKVLKKQFTIF